VADGTQGGTPRAAGGGGIGPIPFDERTRGGGIGPIPFDVGALDFAKGGGHVTVIAQDADSGVVLMVAAADAEAVGRTLATGEMHYTSRTRGLWHKGATSGNVQRVVSLHVDCDGDALLARVRPAGPACHTGAVSCFGEAPLAADAIAQVDATIAARAAALGRPADEDAWLDESVQAAGQQRAVFDLPVRPSWTQRLLADRNLRLKKIGEEAAELVTACADGDAARAAEEAADLVYHALVALRAAGGSLGDVRRVLAARQRA
jgi:phosphoribosyl-ATP pyrophosphohydrolase/phosphoribosyl-AMP cyclohydrolase